MVEAASRGVQPSSRLASDAAEGISVDESGKQYHLDVHVAYRQACLNVIEYLKKFGYSGAQAYSTLGTAPVQGHISGVIDVPNACAECGGFDAIRSLAERDRPADCPDCGAPAARVFVAAPRLALMETGSRTGMATNERARHEPKSSRAGMRRRSSASWRASELAVPATARRSRLAADGCVGSPLRCKRNLQLWRSGRDHQRIRPGRTLRLSNESDDLRRRSTARSPCLLCEEALLERCAGAHRGRRPRPRAGT